MDNKEILIDNVVKNPNNLDVIRINILDVDGTRFLLKTLVDQNQNLMEVFKEIEFVVGHCGGMALCASCHCYIESSHALNPKDLEEESMLDQLQNINSEKSRLICQIPMDKSLDGIVIRIVRD